MEESDAANNEAGTLIDQITGRFDIVVDDLEAAYTMPVGTLWHWKQVIEVAALDNPHLGLVVYVHQNDLFRAIIAEGQVTSSVIRKHCRIASTLDAALDMIYTDRESQKQE